MGSACECRLIYVLSASSGMFWINGDGSVLNCTTSPVGTRVTLFDFPGSRHRQISLPSRTVTTSTWTSLSVKIASVTATSTSLMNELIPAIMPAGLVSTGTTQHVGTTLVREISIMLITALGTQTRRSTSCAGPRLSDVYWKWAATERARDSRSAMTPESTRHSQLASSSQF